MRKILVISHDASLTGAPILLLHALRLLKSNYNFTILLKKGGELESEFSEIAKTVILKNKNYSVKKNLLCMVKDRLTYFVRLISVPALFYNADLLFSNTIANGRLLHYFRYLRKPVITYVHELESVLKYFSTQGDTQFSFKYSQFLLFPSLAVKANLIKNYAISNDKMMHFPYYFPLENFPYSKELKLQCRSVWNGQWNLPEVSKLVVGMGVVSSRKGTDKFIEIAEEVLSRAENVYFFWIGDFDSTPFAEQIRFDYSNKKYNERLVFTGRMKYAYTNLVPFDLFFLSSAEDPYPLVALEAAYQGVPTLFFQGTGGTDEWIGDEEGYILENDSVDHVVETILSLLKSERDLVKRGLKAREKAIKLHSNKKIIEGVFDNVVKKIIL